MLIIYCKDGSSRVLKNFGLKFEPTKENLLELSKYLEGRNYLSHKYEKVGK